MLHSLYLRMNNMPMNDTFVQSLNVQDLYSLGVGLRSYHFHKFSGRFWCSYSSDKLLGTTPLNQTYARICPYLHNNIENFGKEPNGTDGCRL